MTVVGLGLASLLVAGLLGLHAWLLLRQHTHAWRGRKTLESSTGYLGLGIVGIVEGGKGLAMLVGLVADPLYVL